VKIGFLEGIDKAQGYINACLVQVVVNGLVNIPTRLWARYRSLGFHADLA
jgi:hypothetical protein